VRRCSGGSELDARRRWMIVVYRYDDRLDQVWILTIRDARSAR
jgi:hypothetical protein